MMIQFIAHDLHCHIVVFNLLLDTVQFCSGNHLKDNNVVFDSPLMIYSTGSHFQSVFPKSHEYFIQYAHRLEEENNGQNIPNQFPEKKKERSTHTSNSDPYQNINCPSNSSSSENVKINFASSISKKNEKLLPKIQKKEKFSKEESITLNERRKEDNNIKDDLSYITVGLPKCSKVSESALPYSKIELPTKKEKLYSEIKVSNRYQCFSKEDDAVISDAEDELNITIEKLKKIRKKSELQKKLYEKLMKQKRRINQSQAQKDLENQNKRQKRLDRTNEKKQLENKKSKERMEKMRMDRTDEIKQIENKKTKKEWTRLTSTKLKRRSSLKIKNPKTEWRK